MNMSNAMEIAILNTIFRGTAAPTQFFFALFSTLPGEDGTGGTELSGGGYARVACHPGTGNWSAAATVSGAGQSANAVDITWPAATGSWGTANAVGFFSASTGGTYYGGVALDAARVIESGTTFKIPAGGLKTTAE